jgi:hypothetical protein
MIGTKDLWQFPIRMCSYLTYRHKNKKVKQKGTFIAINTVIISLNPLFFFWKKKKFVAPLPYFLCFSTKIFLKYIILRKYNTASYSIYKCIHVNYNVYNESFQNIQKIKINKDDEIFLHKSKEKYITLGFAL